MGAIEKKLILPGAYRRWISTLTVPSALALPPAPRNLHQNRPNAIKTAICFIIPKWQSSLCTAVGSVAWLRIELDDHPQGYAMDEPNSSNLSEKLEKSAR